MSSEWGTKRVCTACSTLFYDFNKSPITCPKCGESVSPDDFIKKRSKYSDKFDSDTDDIERDIIEENLDIADMSDHDDEEPLDDDL